MDSVRYYELPMFFQGATEIFAEKKEEFCKMDTKTGSGDPGLTMEKGSGAMSRLIREDREDGNIRKTLIKASMKVSGLVPPTMGAPMVSGIMEGTKALGGKAETGPKEFSEFLNGFARGIERRGKRHPGDRILLDTMDAAARKVLEASKDGTDMVTVIRAATEGARVGTIATKGTLPKFGKAAVFSAETKGIPDQGAVAGQYLLERTERYFLS